MNVIKEKQTSYDEILIWLTKHVCRLANLECDYHRQSN